MGIGFFSSEIAPSPLFHAYKLIKQMEKQGKERAEINQLLKEHFSDRKGGCMQERGRCMGNSPVNGQLSTVNGRWKEPGLRVPFIIFSSSCRVYNQGISI